MAEPGELLESAFRHILASGYDGILVVMDEMSEYMNRTKSPNDDEDCLLTLSSVLAKGKHLPIWTIVAAQAQYQKQDKIVGPDRMRSELLEHKPERFRNIVINRVRKYKIVKGKSQLPLTHNYYLGYRETIPWVHDTEEEVFQDCFPFPPEAVEVLKAISSKLTGTRSTIGFLHSALQGTLAAEPGWNDLIPLYRVFGELMTYQESKSNSASGTISVKSIFREEAAALDSAQRKLGKIETGLLGKKRGKQRAERILNTLFLYKIAGYGGLTSTQILNAVCDLKGDDGLDIQVGHYETLLEEMKSELRGQIRNVGGTYEFVPKETGEFDDVVNQAGDVLRKDAVAFWSYYEKLLEYSQEPKSPFSDFRGNSLVKHEISWHGQERTGQVGFRDLTIKGRASTPDTANSEHDFVIVLSRKPASDAEAKEYLKTDPKNPDPRVVIWVPAALTPDQKTSLINVLAYLRVMENYSGTKHAKDAHSSFQLQAQTAYDLLKQVYQQGKARTCRKSIMVDWTGGLEGALERMASEALDDCYRSAEIDTKPRTFGPNEAVKLINGLVKRGEAVPVSNSLHSAVENFAKPLKLVRAPDLEKLDPSTSDAYKEIRDFAKKKVGHPMPVSVFYNKFTGWQPEDGPKSWGLTRRMVDVYLLAMAQLGVVKINLKKGDVIDRNTIDDLDFKPETLRNFESVELPKALIDWSILSPFLEIMAGEASGAYGPEYEQVTAHKALARVAALWIASDKMDNLLSRVSSLFRDLGQEDPYDSLLLFWMSLFAAALPVGSDVEVFDSFKSSVLRTLEHLVPEDITTADREKFAKNWAQFLALQKNFDDQASLVRCAGSYAKSEIPEVKEYKTLAKAIDKLKPLVERARDFVVEPDRTNAELRPALEAVWKEHDGPFMNGCQAINEALSDLKEAIELAKTSQELHILEMLSSALPEATSSLKDAHAAVAEADRAKFQSLPVGEELKKILRERAAITTSSGVDLHLKNLRPTASRLKEVAKGTSDVPNCALERVATFLDDGVFRERLGAYSDKKLINNLLGQKGRDAIRKYALGLGDEDLKELSKILEAVLKGVEFVALELTSFKPSLTVLWGDEEISSVVKEFDDFLRASGKGKVVKIS